MLACVPYADGLSPKMSVGEQEAVREVVDAYSPHLVGCVSTLFGEAWRAEGQQEGPACASEPQVLPDQLGLQALLDACLALSPKRTAAPLPAVAASR